MNMPAKLTQPKGALTMPVRWQWQNGKVVRNETFLCDKVLARIQDTFRLFPSEWEATCCSHFDLYRLLRRVLPERFRRWELFKWKMHLKMKALKHWKMQENRYCSWFVGRKKKQWNSLKNAVWNGSSCSCHLLWVISDGTPNVWWPRPLWRGRYFKSAWHCYNLVVSCRVPFL